MVPILIDSFEYILALSEGDRNLQDLQELPEALECELRVFLESLSVEELLDVHIAGTDQESELVQDTLQLVLVGLVGFVVVQEVVLEDWVLIELIPLHSVLLFDFEAGSQERLDIRVELRAYLQGLDLNPLNQLWDGIE